MTPTLHVNGDNLNSAIVNYNSDYADGDVLLGEIRIAISELNSNSSTLQIAGKLTGIYLYSPEEKLGNAQIKLIDSQRKRIEAFRSDSLGGFDIGFDYQSGYLLEFSYIGYRTLFVDISKLVAKI